MRHFTFNPSGIFMLSTMKQLLIVALSTIIMCYFSWHALYGSMGLFNYWHIKQDLEIQTLKLNQLKQTRAQLENHAKLLNPSSTDKDLIDEIARKSLGLVSSSERVIIVEDKGTVE